MDKLGVTNTAWEEKPRTISIVVDNPSWILPYAERLVGEINTNGDRAFLCLNHEEVKDGCIAFFLGCIKIASPNVLSKNFFNLVVHESDLPKGKGFAPVAWQILEGKKKITICLIEADNNADAGDIYYLDSMVFEGHELNNEIREKQGNKTIELCLRFLNEVKPPKPFSQVGESTYYRRRTPKDSMLSINKTIEEQFNLFRIVDNKRYPAYFEIFGHRYRLTIVKIGELKGKDS